MEHAGQSKSKVECKKSRLAEAISSGRLYQTRTILEDNPNLNYLDEQGLSPLMRAFMIEDEKHRTRLAMIKILLQHKADVNLKDSEGKHVLIWACKMNKFDLVKLLLEKSLQDIDLTAKDVQGNTPLMYAVGNNNVAMVRLIVNAMTKFSLTVDERNSEDKTPYYKAVEMGFDECARILTDVGKASRFIKVNPFLDFLAIDNSSNCNRVRVSSASATNKDCASRNNLVGRKHATSRRTKVVKIGDRSKKIVSKKSGGNRSLIPGITHKEVFQTKLSGCESNRNVPEARKGEQLHSKRTRQNAKYGCVEDSNGIFNENRFGRKSDFHSCQPGGKYSDYLPGRQSFSQSRQESFFRLILDETTNDYSRSLKSNSPLSFASNPSSRSISPVNNFQERHKRIVPTINNFLKSSEVQTQDLQGNFGGPCLDFARVSEPKSTRTSPNYLDYLKWKASVDYTPNTLRHLLAVQAEQQSEISSYRKGHVIPKYEPGTDEFVVGEDRNVEVFSSFSERSVKSEAARKISAVAKTVGLSVYLSSKRKNSNKNDSG